MYLRCFGNVQLLLSKHDSSSVDVWCCSTTGCFRLLELLRDYSLCWTEIMRDGDAKIIEVKSLTFCWKPWELISEKISTVVNWERQIVF